MRFVWLREHTDNPDIVKQVGSHPLALIRTAYNAVFWIFLIPFFTSMEYSTGFIAFTVVILVRLVLNLYTNNAIKLTPEGYEKYPFRIP